MRLNRVQGWLLAAVLSLALWAMLIWLATAIYHLSRLAPLYAS